MSLRLYRFVLLVAALATVTSAISATVTSQPVLHPDSRNGLQRLLHSNNPFPVNTAATRYDGVAAALAGYEMTGVPLVAFNGREFVQAGFGDDVGWFYFAPRAAMLFGWSIDRTITILLLGLAGLAALLGGWGLFLLTNDRLSRAYAVAAVAVVTAVAIRIGDLYVFEYAVPMLLAPWALVALKRRMSIGLLTGCVVLYGLLLGLVSQIRITAAFNTFCFVTAVVALGFTASRARKAALIAALVLAACIPQLIFGSMLRRRDNFIRTSNARFTPAEGREQLWRRLGPGFEFHSDANSRPPYVDNTGHHEFWHSAYLGFAFLANPYVPGGVQDSTAIEKVRSIDPEAAYLSPRYEAILRDQVLHILTHQPVLVLYTALAKLGVIAGLLILFANLGLIARVMRPQAWRMEAVFWAGILAATLSAALIAPIPAYSLGVMSFAMLYGVTGLAELRRRQLPRATPERKLRLVRA